MFTSFYARLIGSILESRRRQIDLDGYLNSSLTNKLKEFFIPRKWETPMLICTATTFRKTQVLSFAHFPLESLQSHYLSSELKTANDFLPQGNDGNQNGAEDLYDDVLTTPAVPESAPEVKPQQAPQLMQQSIVPPSVSAASPAPPPHQSSPSVHHGQPNSGKRYSLYVG